MFDFHNSSVIYISQPHGDDCTLNGFAPAADEYGNGPFKTLERALTAVGQCRVSGCKRPLTIRFTDDYYLSDTVNFDVNTVVRTTDLFLSGITLESYGERKRIIGGIRISGWKHDTFNGVNCLCADLPKKADGSQWDAVDLIVNGKRAKNTRYPKSGYLKAVETENDFAQCDSVPFFAGSKWVKVNKEDLENIDGIESATVNFYHYWVDEHTPIESYDKSSGILTFKYPSRFTVSTIYSPKEHTSAFRYHLENLPSTFGNANEWYLDKTAGKVYYLPEEMPHNLEKIEAFLPTVKKLFEVHGRPNQAITDMRFSNLEFIGTRSDYASKLTQIKSENVTESVCDEDAFCASDIQAACDAHGAISFMYADRCSVSNCRIHHTGTYGIEIKNGCNCTRIENNVFDDIGAGAINVHGGSVKSDLCERTKRCILRGNTITNCGVKIAAACGILIQHAAENEISDNEIAYLNYSGISVGWTWGYADNVTYGNIIRANHIHHIGKGELSDLGGIYLLGKQPGTVVSYNRIHDVSCALYGGHGIYADEGTSYITVENNVVYNTKDSSFHQHFGSCNVVRNNVFALGSCAISVTRNEVHDCALFENNILVTAGKPLYKSSFLASTITAKKNLIYDTVSKAPVLYVDPDGKEWGFERWQSGFGKDCGSMIGDPLFKDAKNDDFTIAADSPAISIGFQPITGFAASGK